MKTFLAIVILTLSTFQAHADEQQNRFCLQKIKAPNDVVGIDEEVRFKNSPFDMYYLGKMPKRVGAVLKGNEFKEISLIFNKRVLVDLPDGKIIGYGSKEKAPVGLFTLFEFNQQTLAFEEMKLEGDADELRNEMRRVHALTWSTPLEGVLMVKGGGADINGQEQEGPKIFLLKDNFVSRFEGIDAAVQIFDFPELDLTFLGNMQGGIIYILDAKKELHELTFFGLGKGMFIRGVHHIRDPDRLLIFVEEALGLFRGKYLVNLVNKDGVWLPSEEQDFTNALNTIPYETPLGISFHKKGIPMPDSKVTVFFENEAIVLKNEAGEILPLDTQEIEYSSYMAWRWRKYLEDEKAMFISARNGYFLLKDRNIHGRDACNK